MMANYDIGHGMMVKIFTESLRGEEILEMWPLLDSLQGHKNIFKSDAKPLYNGPQSLKWVKTRKAEAITQKELLLLLLAWLWTFEEMLESLGVGRDRWCPAPEVVWARGEIITSDITLESPAHQAIMGNNQPVVRRCELSLHLCRSSEKPATDSLK